MLQMETQCDRKRNSNMSVIQGLSYISHRVTTFYHICRIDVSYMDLCSYLISMSRIADKGTEREMPKGFAHNI